MKEHLQKIWKAHESAAFPAGCRGKKVQNVDLTILESQIAAAVLTALETNGVLGIRINRELTEAEKQLSLVIKELTGDAQTYFKRLEKIVQELREWTGNTQDKK